MHLQGQAYGAYRNYILAKILGYLRVKGLKPKFMVLNQYHN